MQSQFDHSGEASHIGDEIAGEYDRLCQFMDGFSWYQDHEILELINNIVPATCKLGLDIGCGTGTVLSYLAENRSDVHWIGIDKSSEMAARAKAKCASSKNVTIQEFDWKNLKRDSSAKGFDFILLKNVLHLVGDVSQKLAILPALLSPTGRILIVETVSPNFDAKRFVSRLSVVLEKVSVKKHIFTARELVRVARKARLDITKIQYHDQFIELRNWLNAKASSPDIVRKALSQVQKEMHSDSLKLSMKYSPPTDECPGKMLRRQILIQCLAKPTRPDESCVTLFTS